MGASSGGIVQQGMVGMVVGTHGVGDGKPAVTALAGALGLDDLNDRGAHLDHPARCFWKKAKIFSQPSNACSMQYMGRW